MGTVLAKVIKRYFFLLHRWLGIATCLLFLLWFASGIVMMYVPYPELTEAERLQALPALNPELIRIPVERAVAELPGGSKLKALTVGSLLGRPVYRLRGSGGERITVFADDGSRFAGLSPAEAEQVASTFRPGNVSRYEESLYMDQWTVAGGLTALRPLHKVALADGAGTFVYVSEVSGELVRDTAFRERAWNWLGSTIHWIYPMQLRKHPGLWANVVITLSVAGMLVLISGIYTGLQRLRLRRRYRGGRRSPYQGWHKWHHVLGLFSAVFICTYLFSGLLSMNPWGVFDNSSSPGDQIARYTGGYLQTSGAQAILERLARSNSRDRAEIRELEWAQLDGQGYFIARRGVGESTLLLADGVAGEHFDTRVRDSIPKLLPDADIRSMEVLSGFDNYYYSRHSRHRPLPVYRVKFADEAATWFHIDVNTGRVLNRLTATDRVQRWLYNGLHSLDFRFLITQRPLWDLVVILLSVAGIIFSLTAIVLAWRRTAAWQRRAIARRNKAACGPVLTLNVRDYTSG